MLCLKRQAKERQSMLCNTQCAVYDQRGKYRNMGKGEKDFM